MSEDNKLVARRLVERMDRGDFGVFDEACAADYRCHFAGAGAPRSRDQHREAARATTSGTHRGDFLGVPPTGRPVSFDVIATFQIHKGKISEEWVLADLMGLQRQLTSGSQSALDEERQGVVRSDQHTA